MAKSDPVERALDRLGELRKAETSPEVTEEIRRYLRSRTNLVVAKAAKVAGELKVAALVPDLVAAFNKLMADAPRLDKRCAATAELVRALYELDYDEPAPYLAGIRHVQMEGSYGPPVDEAAKLRAVSAQGLLRTRYSESLSAVLELLVDREPEARVGAIRALAVNGGEVGVLLLRLKALTGDTEAMVLGECFTALLAACGDRLVSFVATYIESEDEEVAEAATLALGESRLPAAYEVLKEKWNRTIGIKNKRVLLAAMAATRLEDAVAFLVSLIDTENVQLAEAVVEALAIYRGNERIRDSARAAVETRGDRSVTERFRREFEI